MVSLLWQMQSLYVRLHGPEIPEGLRAKLAMKVVDACVSGHVFFQVGDARKSLIAVLTLVSVYALVPCHVLLVP